MIRRGAPGLKLFDTGGYGLYVDRRLHFMAENLPSPPSGAVPPKPAEAAKIQPKKETVRINLPPKPTAAPTIKIPAPAASVSVAAAAPVAPNAGTHAPASVSAPPATPSTPPPPPAATARPVAAAPAMSAAPRPIMAARQAAPAVSGLDKGLAIAAAVISVAALVRVVMLTS